MELKILDANLWLLPFPFSRDKERRFKNFLKVAKRLNPHIITLQEVWLNKYLRLLRENFPDYYFIRKKRSMYNRTGLVTLSKIKPLKVAIMKFKVSKNFSFVERMASKGLIIVTLPSKKYKKLSIVNTHLYAPTNKKEKIIDEEEIKFIENLSIRGNWIVCGDLNISKKNFDALNKKFFDGEKRDFIQTSTRGNNYRKNNWFDNTKDGKIDYVLFRTRPKIVKSISHQVIKNPEVSDHYPIFSKINLF